MRPKSSGNNLLKQRYECKVCHKRFPYQYRFKDHLNVHTGKKKFKCGVCGRRYLTRDSLSSHSYSHKNRFKCSHCNKQFSSKYNLQRHLKKKGRYNCLNCEMYFPSKNCLFEHKRTSHLDRKVRKGWEKLMWIRIISFLFIYRVTSNATFVGNHSCLTNYQFISELMHLRNP